MKRNIYQAMKRPGETRFLDPPTMCNYNKKTKKTAVCEPGSGSSIDTESVSTMTSGFSVSRTVTNKFLLFSYPAYGILLQ